MNKLFFVLALPLTLSLGGCGVGSNSATCAKHNPGAADVTVDCKAAICACEAAAASYSDKCGIICKRSSPYHCQQNVPTGPVWTIKDLDCSECDSNQTCP